MNKSAIKYFLLLLINMLLGSMKVMSQNNSVITLLITVKDEANETKLGGASMIIYKNGGQFESLTVPENGKIKKELQLGHTYDIKFGKEGYAQKIARIDTRNVPKEEQPGGYEFTMEVFLFQPPSGFNTDILKEPAAKAIYMSDIDKVDWDEEYIRKQKEKIDAEFKRVKDARKADEAKYKEFDKLIAEGDDEVIVKRYESAIAKYEAAQKLFPGDALPKQKIAKVQELMGQADEAKKEEARYRMLLIDGEEAMKNSQWEVAQAKFNEAKKMKPKEKEPTEKLAELDKRMKNAAKYAQYDAVIKDADRLFQAEKWEECMAKYKEASNMMPQETYPKERFARAKELLEKSKLDADAQNKKNKRYAELMSLGQKGIDKKDYSTAIVQFQEAANLKPDEQLPKDKINEINRLLKEQEDAIQAKKVKEKEDLEAARKRKEYDAVLKNADDMFKAAASKDLAKLSQSKEFYNQALAILPAEGYPKAQIAEVDALITKLKGEMNAAELEKQMKEAERLKKEAEMKQALIDQEERALAERRRREEEEAEKKRKLDEALNSAVKTGGGGGNMSGSAAEDALDAFYREARRQRSQLRADSIEQEKRKFHNYDRYFNQKNEMRLEETIKDLNGQVEINSRIHIRGEKIHESNIQTTQEENNKYAEASKQLLLSSAKQRDGRIEDTETFKKMILNVSTKSESMREKSSRISVQKQEIANEQSSYQQRSVDRTKMAVRDLELQRKEADKALIFGVESQKARVGEFMEANEALNSNNEFFITASASKRDMNMTNVSSQKESLIANSQDKKDLRDENLMAIDDVKYNTQLNLMAKKSSAEENGFDKRDELFKTAVLPKHQTRSEIIANVQEEEDAITERSFDVGNKKVLERTVKTDGQTFVYRKIVSTAGVYYFKNGLSITEQTWKDETTNLMTK
ncbi:MAG: hypothetical protein RLY35_438 [Bacteroidota bacterium]|jgi:hypothetical protein